MNSKPQYISDSLGRIHNYLRISLTERCNLRCFYCMPEEGIPLRNKASFMRQEEVLEIAKIFTELGVNKIRLTGGEPLIRKDVDQIIRGLSKLPVELGVTTNGVLADKFVNVFKDSGVSSINFSLDSLIKEKQILISRIDYFDRILSNIQLYVDQGFEVKINAVVMKNVNDHELIDFVEWTKDQPLHVRFIEFMPFDGNKWNWDKKVSHKEMLDKILNHYSSTSVYKLVDKPHDTAKNYRVAGYKGTFGIISPVTNPFCDTCNRIRLTADGKIKSCLFSESEIDLLQTYRQGKDIVPLILKSIWHKKAVRGGIDSFEDGTSRITKRSMVSIGG